MASIRLVGQGLGLCHPLAISFFRSGTRSLNVRWLSRLILRKRCRHCLQCYTVCMPRFGIAWQLDSAGSREKAVVQNLLMLGMSSIGELWADAV